MSRKMDIKVIFISFAIFIAQSYSVDDNDDGFYHPEKYLGPDGDDGHYVHDNSGQYVHDPSGQYQLDRSGEYRPEYPRFYKAQLQKFRNNFGRFANYLERNPNARKYEEAFGNRKSLSNPEPSDPMLNYKDDSEDNVFPSSTFSPISISSPAKTKPTLSSFLTSHNSVRFSDNDRSNFFGNSAAGTSFHPKTTHNTLRQAPATFNQARYKTDGPRWRILKQNGDVSSDGYHWDYETENGIQAEETGKVDNVGSNSPTMRAKGQFKYTGPDNVVYSVTYTADENGFVAQGNHLPTPPPIPTEIVKSLDFNRSGGHQRGKF